LIFLITTIVKYMEVKTSIKRIDYTESMSFLEQRVEDVLNDKKDELLWVLEHNSVFTSGVSSKEDDILDKSIKVLKSNRGGKITYHGPGQKVVYFVLNLNKREKDIRKLLNNLENCIIDVLKEYEVNSYPDKKNIGIWVGDLNNQKKIAAIGIKVKKWIAYHGFSLNISNDLDLYKKIIPCGIKDKGIINLKEIGINNFDNIEKIIINKFLNIFL
jgi:lipoyl(octanoyl) transferase